MIVAYRGTSWLSWLIRWRTWSTVSHVGWLCDDGTLIEAWRHGVRHVATPGMDHEPGTVIDVYDVPGVMRGAVEYFLRKQLGKPYDWWGLLGFLVRRRRQDSRAWFCSELICAAVRAGGVELLRKPDWQVSPGDVVASPCVTWLRREVL